MKKKLIGLFAICIFISSSGITNAQNNPATLPIGIDTRGLALSGSKGSANWNMGIQAPVREDVNKYSNVQKYDATRYLEKAVKENPDDLERIKKLLDAGASAFITYEMIDKKQYDLIDLMYKSNPKLIRFSQLIHYAAAHSDSTMIDFLVERGASLDLCGCYFEKYNDNGRLLCRKQCQWNEDEKYVYTPADVALKKVRYEMVNYISRKYGRLPTIDGWTNFIYLCLKKGAAKSVSRFLNGYNKLPGNGIFVGNDNKRREATKDVLNHGRFTYRNHGTNSYYFDYESILILTVQKMGEYRTNGNKEKADEFFELIKLMVEKGANVNIENQHPSFGYYGILDDYVIFETPMYTALQAPNMLDVIKYLKEKGAKMTVRYFQKGRVNTIDIKNLSIRDEYKEAMLIGEL